MTHQDTAAAVVVVRNEAARRYEARVGDDLAGIAQYRMRDDAVVFTHTEVYPRFEGQGVGGELIRQALDDVIGSGRRIVPECPFVAEYIDKHPSYRENVD